MPRAVASHHTLGVKEVLELGAERIDERFGVGRHEGVDIEILGCTGEIPGGGFLYTNADTVSVGVVLSLPHLAASGARPEELIADLRAHPSIAPLVRGAASRASTRRTSSPRAATTPCPLWSRTGYSSPVTRRP